MFESVFKVKIEFIHDSFSKPPDNPHLSTCWLACLYVCPPSLFFKEKIGWSTCSTKCSQTWGACSSNEVYILPCMEVSACLNLETTWIALKGVGLESLTLTRANWEHGTCTLTYLIVERIMVWVGLSTIYEKVGYEIAKEVGITYAIINYNSPTHTRETCEVPS
jgi:hypothetical protein